MAGPCVNLGQEAGFDCIVVLNELLVWFGSLLSVQFCELGMQKDTGKFSVSYHLEPRCHGLSYHTGGGPRSSSNLKNASQSVFPEYLFPEHLNSLLECRFLSRLCPSPYGPPQSLPAALADGSLHRWLPSSARGLPLASEQYISERKFRLRKTTLSQERKGVRVNTPASPPFGRASLRRVLHGPFEGPQ